MTIGSASYLACLIFHASGHNIRGSAGTALARMPLHNRRVCIDIPVPLSLRPSTRIKTLGLEPRAAISGIVAPESALGD